MPRIQNTMILFFTLVIFNDLKPSQAIELRPGEPVPHAEVLDQMLVRHNIINSSISNDGSLFDFLFGNEDTPSEKLNDDNLDISVLDYQNIHKIVDIAKKKYRKTEDSRRQYPPYESVLYEAYYSNPFFIAKALDMMKQSVYATRYRLEKMRSLRKRYQSDITYNLAFMFGSVSQLMFKMENMYSQMSMLPYKTHFIWFLIFYEKMLAAHVDITTMIRRIFDNHKKWHEEKTRGKTEKEEQ